MASYKVIQDVEADDKLIGPLTLRQSVYAFIVGLLGFMIYFVISKGAAFLALFFLPPLLVAGFFAFPWSHEQSTEVWALARIRFLVKPRRRIWNQSGMKELVTVTAPKRIEEIYTDGLSQTEVRSRLRALAATIDSRGWAIKNTANPYGAAYAMASDDRLLGMSNLPQEVPVINDEPYADMLDPGDNQVAQKFDSILNQNAKSHHTQLLTSLQQAAPPQQQDSAQTPEPTKQVQAADPATDPPADFWFLNNQANAPANPIPLVAPGAPQDQAASAQTTTLSPYEEQALVETLRAHETKRGPAYEYSHLPTILPLAEREKLEKQNKELQAAAKTKQPKSNSTMTDKHQAAILELAGNDDLNVATIAREAKKSTSDSDDEVVISLH